MNEEHPEEKLPINPIYSWLRVILWLIPISFFMPSAAMVFAGKYLGLDETITSLLGYGSFALFLTGAGWCDFKLAGSGWKKSFNLAGSVAFYLFCQVILVTIILFSLIGVGFFD